MKEDKDGLFGVDESGKDDEFKGLDDVVFEKDPVPTEPVHVPKPKRVKKTRRDKALRVMRKRAEISTLPSAEDLLRGKTGSKIRISDIAIFSTDNEDDELMAGLAQECPLRNRLNKAEVLKSRILVVGSQILSAGRMWQPIHVSKMIEDGVTECTSGRHRLAFLALVYGPDLEVPVYMEHLSLRDAMETVAVSNEARSEKAMERAAKSVVRAVGGDLEADQDSLYDRLARSKPGVRKYCVFSVLTRGYPSKLTFKTSEKSSRPDGGITTVTNVENFWNTALEWERGVERKHFDISLGESVKFLNSFIGAIQKVSGFDSNHHLSARVMAAVGRYYRVYEQVKAKNAIVVCGELSKKIVGLGEVGRWPEAEIYKAISEL